MNYENLKGKKVLLTLKNGKKIKGIVNCVCDEGDDEPEAQFIMINDKDYLFSEIENVEQIGGGKIIKVKK